MNGSPSSTAKVVPRPSSEPGAGMGLFVSETEGFAKGSRIIEYTGRVLTFKEARVLRDRTYLKAVSLDRHIDGSSAEASVAKFINDSLDKGKINCAFKKDGGRVFVVATRDLAPGEELFVSYGRAHWIFGGVPAFLGLCIGKEGGVCATANLDEGEILFAFSSDTVNIDGRLAAAVARGRTAAECNCELKKNPFVPKTVMVRATRRIKTGEWLKLNQ